MRESARRLFEGPDARARFVADEAQLAGALTASLTPDVSLSPPASEVGFLHRTTGSEEIYFLANTGNEPQSLEATFRVEGMEPEWWDPIDGSVHPLPVARRAAGRVSVALDLEPYGSRVVVFSRGAPRAFPPRAATATLKTIELDMGWNVLFGTTGAVVPMDRLRSWTEDESTRYYSGTVSYVKDFVVADDFLRDGLRLILDLGATRPAPAPQARVPRMQALVEAPVREAAVVYCNYRRAGSAWCPPYAVDVTGLVKRGENRIRIVVANTAINHMAGRRQPDYKLLNLRYGVRFEPQDMDNLEPLPSGLLGSVRLLAR